MIESANASLSEEGIHRLLFREQGQARNSFVLFQGVLLLIRYVGVSKLVIGGGINQSVGVSFIFLSDLLGLSQSMCNVSINL